MAFKQQKLIPPSSRGWKLKIMVVKDSMLGSSHFLPNSHLLCGLMWWEVQGKHSPASFVLPLVVKSCLTRL